MNEERWRLVKAGLRSIFFDDLITKAIALLITFVIWYGVTGRRTPSTVRLRNVHLSLQLPTNTEISNDVVVDDVEITVTGDKNRLDRLNSRDLVVVADLSDFKPGELIVQLKPETVNLSLPSGVKLDEIEPNRISIKLEPRIERLVEVRPVFTGQLPEGYEIYATIIKPQFIRVRGAASRVNALDKVPTEEIDLNIQTGSFVEKQTTIDLLDPKITVLDAVVDVEVMVGEQRLEKSFAGVPVIGPALAKAKPENATVTLFGSRSTIESLNPEDLRIELESMPDGVMKPRLILPDNLQNSNIETREIKPNGFTIDKN